MHRPPDTVEIGEHLTQDEIEDQFNTGFGYQISGINPRRDQNDDRYILLFATEDGPYDDSVTEGQFTYIGEGLEGDQSETSSGNSALIDAISTAIPIYFFHSTTDQSGWEYQGQVDIIEYQRETQHGREILLFTMEYKTDRVTDRSSPGLYFIPVSDYWRSRFRNCVESPLNLTKCEEVPPQLEGIETLRIWATTETDASKKQAAIDSMASGDYVLFYYNGDFFAGGIVGRAFEEPAIGELIWNQSKSRYIYTIDEFTNDVSAIERVWELVGYEGRQVVQGFSRVADNRVSSIRSEHGPLDSVLFDGDAATPTEEEIEQQKESIRQTIASDPELTEKEPHYTETQQRARNNAFRNLIREAYQNTCAVCESHRESPTGAPEVEAAHIYPKSENGKDDIRNGIALCKLHHWAFDSGWISVTDDCTVLVAEAPDKHGYHEMKQLEGRSLHLPQNEDEHPHPVFLRKHREIHDFE
jgi:putative restriction endonuclease